MDINSVSGNSADTTRSPSSTSPTGSSRLGKDEFVKLLLAQLAHQDPTSPQSNEAFVAQLAQFANVELMQNANQNLESLLVAQAAGNQTGVAQLVGKDVVFKTDHVDLKDGESTDLDIELAGQANDVVVTITDDKGNVVRTEHLGQHDAGGFDYTWDGKDDHGNSLPNGSYTVAVAGTDGSGGAVDATMGAKGHVDGVSFANGAPQLIVGSLKIALGDVVSVSEADATESDAPPKEKKP